MGGFGLEVEDVIQAVRFPGMNFVKAERVEKGGIELYGAHQGENLACTGVEPGFCGCDI